MPFSIVIKFRWKNQATTATREGLQMEGDAILASGAALSVFEAFV